MPQVLLLQQYTQRKATLVVFVVSATHTIYIKMFGTYTLPCSKEKSVTI